MNLEKMEEMEARDGARGQEDEDLKKEEIREALKKMKNKKAKSIDRSVEICERYVMEKYDRVINISLESEIPKDWRQSIIVSLKEETQNWQKTIEGYR